MTEAEKFVSIGLQKAEFFAKVVYERTLRRRSSEPSGIGPG